MNFTNRKYSWQLKVMKVSVNVLFQNCYLLRVEEISKNAYKAGSLFFKGVVFKICDEHHRPFLYTVKPVLRGHP